MFVLVGHIDIAQADVHSFIKVNTHIFILLRASFKVSGGSLWKYCLIPRTFASRYEYHWICIGSKSNNKRSADDKLSAKSDVLLVSKCHCRLVKYFTCFMPREYFCCMDSNLEDMCLIIVHVK